jgi:hypothetical protein
MTNRMKGRFDNKVTSIINATSKFESPESFCELADHMQIVCSRPERELWSSAEWHSLV